MFRSLNPTSIICNLKKAHPLIEQRDAVLIQKYINSFVSKNFINIPYRKEYNNKIVLKSLMPKIKLVKNHSSLRSPNYSPISINKSQKSPNNNNNQNELSEVKVSTNRHKPIKRAFSYNKIIEEKEIFSYNK